MSATTVVRWEAPPPDARGKVAGSERSPRRNYAAIADQLRQRPGEWAVVAELPYVGGASLAHRINWATADCWRPVGSFEATSRYLDGMTVVYARFLGARS